MNRIIRNLVNKTINECKRQIIGVSENYVSYYESGVPPVEPPAQLPALELPRRSRENYLRLAVINSDSGVDRLHLPTVFSSDYHTEAHY